MGFLGALFGVSPAVKTKPRRAGSGSASQSSFQSSSASGFSHSSLLNHAPAEARHQFTVRRDLLRLTLRDMLTRTGIPNAWVEIQPVAATSSTKGAGVHVRFLVKHWNPQLMMHAPGLEHAFVQRLMLLDPLADQWVLGFSWQLALAPDVLPAPLPRPGAWTAQPQAPREVAAPTPPLVVGGDVISGPVHIGAPPPRGGKADLEQLLAAGDATRRGGSFDATEPSPLN